MFLKESFLMNMVWLRRCFHSRGFGIQSPSVYRFVRYVINEHYLYYAYDDLKHKYPKTSPVERKLLQLYFRIANACQAHNWVIIDKLDNPEVYGRKVDYIQHGCYKTRCLHINYIEQLCEDEVFDVVVIQANNDGIDYFRYLFPHLSTRSLVIVEGIYHNKASQVFWTAIKNSQQVGITFDLYYCGVVFFDKDRYKKNYYINF